MKHVFNIAIFSLLAAPLYCATEKNLVIEFAKGTAATDKDAFSALIASEKPVVVKFGADWCGPCRAAASPFKSMATRFKDRATFVTVDVDKFRSISNTYGVQGIPAFAIFAKGKIVGNLMKIRDLQTNLEAYLSSAKGK